MAKTTKITSTGTLDSVQKIKRDGRYLFRIKNATGPSDAALNNPSYRFYLAEAKALKIANGDGEFPLGVQIKLTGRFSAHNGGQLNHVNIVSVDGVETTAWSQRVGSATVDPDVVRAAKQRVEEAKKAEDAMVNRAPPENPLAITDPETAYENAMRIVRRQRRLKNPQLSQEEIWQVRDALNLLAEKLGIA